MSTVLPFVISPYGYAVNGSSERTLIDNGKQGDSRVTLCAAASVDPDEAETLYYLRTNGNPVMLEDDRPAVWDFVYTIGVPAAEIIAAVAGDAVAFADSRAWAVGKLEDIQRLQDYLDAHPYDVEQTYYGWHARFRDEHGGDGGGWVGKGYPSHADALFELARYGESR